MIDGVRLAFLLRERGLSQSALARRIGISQQAIHKLIVGQSRGSTHIVALARELGTTPAYLAGEIDDPDAGASPPPPKPTAQVATMQVLLPDTRALERMFLAVLKASEGLSQEALAHELALLLPKGLSLLRGPLVFADPVTDDDRPVDPEAVDVDHPARRRA